VRSRRQLWVAPGHALAKIASPSFKDIAQHPYIMVTADEAELSTLGYWKSRRIKPNIVFRTTSIEAVRGLVAHGFGVTVLSDMVFRPWSLEGKRIEARPILDLVPPMEVGALWNPEKEISTPAEAFQQFFEKFKSLPKLQSICQKTLFVEQPIHRDQTLGSDVSAIAQSIPLLVDESDNELDTFLSAAKLGYTGISSKSCKGVYKSIVNAARCRQMTESTGRKHFQSGEDLTMQAGVAVQQDFESQQQSVTKLKLKSSCRPIYMDIHSLKCCMAV
jgi:hypothetical protein